MKIEYCLNFNKFKTREELVKETGLEDRTIRQLISNLKKEKAVIYNSQTSGYRLAKDIETLNEKSAKEEKELIKHCIADIESRKKDLNKSERIYIAYLKELEKRWNA